MNWRELLRADEVAAINKLAPSNPSASSAYESTESDFSRRSRETDHPAVADRSRGSESAHNHDAEEHLETYSQAVPNEFSETTNRHAKDAKADNGPNEHSGALDSQAVSQTREQCAAVDILNRMGVRILDLDSGFALGVWSDLDNGEIRQALRTLKLASLPVRYLDGAGIPARYKLRRVDGKPVPMDVLRAMEQNPEQPWLIRDRMHVGEASLGRRQTPNRP
jgi:hypothetical protein